MRFSDRFRLDVGIPQKAAILLIWFLFVALIAKHWGWEPIAEAQPAIGQRVVTVRAASGTLSAAETTTAITGLARWSQAAIVLDVTTITTPDADDEVDFYLQISYDGGTTWTDVENVHFATADNGATATRVVTIDGALDGPGRLKALTGTDPAAGAEVVETVPSNTIWRLMALRAEFVADGTAATRIPLVDLNDGTNRYAGLGGSSISITAGQTRRLNMLASGYSNGIVNTEFMTGIANILKMPAGHRIETDTIAIQAGDNWGSPILLVEEWHDPRVSTNATIRDNLKSYMRPLGDQLRIRTTITGASAPSYAYSAVATLK